MLQILSGTTIVLSSVLPLVNLETKGPVEKPKLVLQEYQSSTMNYDPFETYREKQIQRIMDRILIDSIKK